MKRQITDESSTVALNNARGARCLVAVGLALFAAMLLVLTMAVRPAAYADDSSASTGIGKPLANTLAPGNVAGGGSATVLVYLNGSDLESQAGEATSDIAEMLESGIGANANVVIETLGTSEWQDYGIASDHTQRYIVNQGKLELVDDSLGQLDTTDPKTLADFIKWGVEKYPADRYILLFWDHGAGPVYGFGYDEFQSEESALTLDEMKQALEANPDVHFDIIGMDCCIMGSLETCLVLQPFCDYMVVSEDFEPGIGWSYERWMGMLEQNPGVDTVELGKVIVDDMIADVAKDEENGDATLALIDESAVNELYQTWVSFAYANKDQLLGTNYSQETEWRDRPGESPHAGMRTSGMGSLFDQLFGDDRESCPSCNGSAACSGCPGDDEWDRLWEEWDFDGSYVTMTDYFVTDIVEVASSVEGNEATALKTAFENAMVHYGSTSGEEGMSGLGVTLPYGDAEFYDQLVKVFKACEIDGEYVDWLEAFVDAEGVDSHYSSNGYGNGSYGAYGYDDEYGYGYGSNDSNAYGYGYGNSNGYGNAYGYGHGSNSANGHGYSYGYGYDDESYGYGYESEREYQPGGHGSIIGKPEWSSGNHSGFDNRHYGSYAA